MKMPHLFVLIALPLLAAPPRGHVPNVSGKPTSLQINASHALARAVRAKATPLPAFNQDLDFLPSLMQGKQVIGLGEESHGTSEFMTLQGSLLRQLVALGFRDLALEVSPDQLPQLNAFINGTQGISVEDSVLPLAIRATREWVETVSWMREYNLKAPSSERIRVWGVDALDISHQVKALQEAFRHDTPDIQRAVSDLLAYASKSLYAPPGGPVVTEVDAQKALAATGVMGGALAARKETPLEIRMALNSVARQIEFALATLQGSVNLEDPVQSTLNTGFQDRAMAEAIRMLAGAGHKVIYLAHNAHVQRGGILANGGYLPTETMCGTLLSMWLRDGYLALAMKTGDGTVTAARWDFQGGLQTMAVGKPQPGSFEAALQKAFPRLSIFLDLRGLPEARMAFPERLIPACHEADDRSMALSVPERAYDGVFFIPSTHASRLLPRPAKPEAK